MPNSYHQPSKSDSSIFAKVAGFESETVQVDRGQILLKQGDAEKDFYVVKSGRLRVVYNLGQADQRIVDEIGRGEPVGEMAIVDEGVRTASVVAIRHTELARVSPEIFERIKREQPEILFDLMKIIATRLRNSLEGQRREPLPATIAVIPANRDAPLNAYCQRLKESLTAAKRECHHISSKAIPSELKSGDEQARNLAKWLNAQEAETEMIVLETDYDLSAWTRQCLTQADLVLVLGRAGSNPIPGSIEAELEGMSMPVARPIVHLVLLQDERAASFSGTAAWLKPRNVTRHYHVRLGSTEDRDRLHRLIIGEDVALVLSGGGARGFSHIGVFRAMQELRIPIDRVAGTSMGAVIGGQIAQGKDWREIADAMRFHFTQNGSLRSLTLPTLSLDTGNRYIKLLKSLFGDTQLEDLPTSFFCMTCNLSRAVAQPHRFGPMWKWVTASISVPGVAPPFVENGDLLTDGGVLNNLPVDVCRSDGAGMVIGVDVSSNIDLKLDDNFSGRPDSWDVLKSRLPSFSREKRPKLPGMFAILNRVSTISSISAKESAKKHADLLIEMPIDGFKMFDWSRIDELIELGYRVGMEQLTTFKEPWN